MIEIKTVIVLREGAYTFILPRDQRSISIGTRDRGVVIVSVAGTFWGVRIMIEEGYLP